MSPAASPQRATALPSPDLLHLEHQLGSEERERLHAITEHLQSEVRHQSVEWWNREELARDLLPALADLGLGRLAESGGSRLFQNLVHAQIARADLSLSALLGIHNELIVGTLEAFGSEKQKQTWLPGLKELRQLGAFCLTEPEHGSDIAGGLATTATRDADGWVLNGSKRWIGLGTVADLALVWARDTADDLIKCFAVDTSLPGYAATKIEHKMGLRIMQNADIELTDLRLPADALLPGAASFQAANGLLKDSRAWVGWQAVGAQQAILDIVRDYALERIQFGRPLASFQLVQQVIAEVAGNLAASSGMMAQVTRVQDADELAMMQAALAKSTATRLARQSASQARDALGGNGLLSHYGIAKVMADIEAIHTYEGSYHINSLIVARALTGVSAFVS
ncbi:MULTISPECIES: acyl-CoA dehydrogenase family protein [Kocuria]|uniref:acyl-CoA dehydrogenase family protein n=1 Tax=Kocuria TaxID=57493 RepID=UPI0011A10651|nr:acyl-CoA dehydrogenase family protein [Kocuria rhizophila]MCT1880080.1 acyl-CoA dehydrogenase family protein [Kocuria rhizophila]WSY88617.1 acyl-CoA dehydrogenase family protein [Kocuria rhizophila]WSZ54045.1 acyl-CoA dehydrogenase family protein [Kocuria rhizophila]